MSYNQNAGIPFDPFMLAVRTSVVAEIVSLQVRGDLAGSGESRKEAVKTVSNRESGRSFMQVLRDVRLFRGVSVRMKALSALLAIAGSGWLVASGFDVERLAGFDGRDVTIASAIIATLVAMTIILLGERSSRTLRAAREFLAGLVLAVGLMTTYNYRFEILSYVHHATGEYVYPTAAARAEAATDGDRTVRIRRRPDGHFIARAEVNGTAMPMLVDTGASTVVLKPADANRLGIDTDKLRYTVPVHTANGTTYAASVKIRNLAVGPIYFKEIDALVSKPGSLKDSLLGMTFLNRLRSYEFSGDFLTLRI